MPILTTLIREAVNAKKFDIGKEQIDLLFVEEERKGTNYVKISLERPICR